MDKKSYIPGYMADLLPVYKKYNRCDTMFILDDTSKEWDKLIKELTSINWHQNLSVTINARE